MKKSVLTLLASAGLACADPFDDEDMRIRQLEWDIEDLQAAKEQAQSEMESKLQALERRQRDQAFEELRGLERE